jgi:hypothetical protein
MNSVPAKMLRPNDLRIDARTIIPEITTPSSVKIGHVAQSLSYTAAQATLQIPLSDICPALYYARFEACTQLGENRK